MSLLEWLDRWEVSDDAGWSLILRIGDEEKHLPPTFVLMRIDVGDKQLEITVADVLKEWRR